MQKYGGKLKKPMSQTSCQIPSSSAEPTLKLQPRAVVHLNGECMIKEANLGYYTWIISHHLDVKGASFDTSLKSALKLVQHTCKTQAEENRRTITFSLV